MTRIPIPTIPRGFKLVQRYRLERIKPSKNKKKMSKPKKRDEYSTGIRESLYGSNASKNDYGLGLESFGRMKKMGF